MSNNSMENNNEMLTFGGHLEVLRKMLFRIIAITACIAIAVFFFKDEVFLILFAPSRWDFFTFRVIENICRLTGIDFQFKEYHIELIATELSSQFMTHLTTSIYIALLGVSPYILYELFRFVSPALYENEKKYSAQVAIIILLLFFVGVLLSYFVIFPISFRFLGTYQVSDVVKSTITLSSYISTFVSLTLVMGIVFQLPVITFFLSKMGAISSEMMKEYRKYAFMIILILSAIITPPDVFTQILVTLPLYLLYEISTHVAK